MQAWLPALLLGGALAALWAFIRGDIAEFVLFKHLRDSRSRRARFRIWVVKACLFFALPTLIGLVLLGRIDALWQVPAEFAPVQQAIGPITLFDSDFLQGLAIGAAISGLAIGALWSRARMRRGRRPPMLGDVGALLPRNRDELPYGAALSVAAGVTEELFFRLLLPLLLVLVTRQLAASFIVAALLFGAAHRYQGWVGVAATTALAGLFTAVYLATGQLWAAMALHVAIDLNGLVLRPILTGAWRARG